MSVRCETCWTRFPVRDAAGHARAGGRTCYFCCEACRRSFREHPDLFPDQDLADRDDRRATVNGPA